MRESSVTPVLDPTDHDEDFLGRYCFGRSFRTAEFFVRESGSTLIFDRNVTCHTCDDLANDRILQNRKM